MIKILNILHKKKKLFSLKLKLQIRIKNREAEFNF